MPRFVSCLVKGPLGCLAFLVGAAIVLVLLLPPVGGRLADRLVEQWFHERHLGSLELADAWIGSFYGPQRVDNLTLRDPDDEEVLRATLSAPALPEFFDHARNGGRLGPVEIRIASLRLVREADGETNLAHALAERARAVSSERGRAFSTDRPLEIQLSVRIERLRYSDARGREEALDGITLTGRFVWGPYETRLELEGGPDGGKAAAPRVSLAFARAQAEPPGPWRATVHLERAPTTLAGLLVPAARALLPLAGAELDELAWQRDGKRVTLSAADAGARLELKGELEEGAIGGSEAAAELVLPCAGGELLTVLLPVLASVECDEPDANHVLHLARAHWPLTGEWSTLAGELELVPAPSAARLAPALAAALAGAHPSEARLDGRSTLRVRAGRLEFAPFRLPLAEGWLELTGTLALSDGTLDARVAGESGGASFELGRWIGTRAALAPAPVPTPVPAESPALPEAPPAPTPEPVPPRRDG